MNTTPLIPPRVQSPSFIRKRNLPTPPPSFADVNDSSSCSSSSSVSSAYSTTTTTSSTTLSDNNNTVASCDLLNIITDARFRPVFQAIDEIKRRKCRPDLERILKYVGKRYTGNNISYQRDEILVILDDLLKFGLITKVFHKGGFTIRIKNEKYAKLIEKMNICYSQKTPTATPMSPHEAMAAAAAAGTINLNDQQWPIAKQYLLNSNEMNNNDHHHHHHHHTRETPSPEFAVFKMESSSSSSPIYSSIDQNNNSGKFPMIKENTPTNGSIVIPSTSTSSTTKLNNKRNRSQSISPNESKKPCLTKTSNSILSSSPTILPIVNNSDEHLFRKPLITNNNLPPITIEQLLGLRGDIPDVHNWSTNELNEFFHQQGYEYASILLNKHHINGNKLYGLKREQVFRMSTLKIGKALKLWNVIEQIQQKLLS
ncbi:unnamed protein product [Rotaria sordida]|uniref:SAMD1-like winged helix (WH) domain-containing protein n=1 Tax=Rotaria sordida TaxID=392033 RepID=A0A815F5U9_9BILA|nr:unnamed protein product [Rotaria sordida]CAF1324718.1 unnamed protein product [Rotaria sordida]CAF1328854.1 unnamed protein product [Rotaria sordida]CAF3725509.1 unnamed protein product [Rotaria sordida]CAF3832117.1 unnamed protein product [Rotaria sordida]